jgi:hypothetical protein
VAPGDRCVQTKSRSWMSQIRGGTKREDGGESP